MSATRARVAAAADLGKTPLVFTILNTAQMNAFTTGGGYVYVYVTRGLLGALNSQGELAAALAHELAHVKAGHTAGPPARSTRDMAMAFGLDLMRWRVGSLMVARTMEQTSNAGFSRDQEDEADQLGVQMLRDAGYDPGAMATMLRALQGASPFIQDGRNRAPQPVGLANHPSTDARIAATSRQAAGLSPQAAMDATARHNRHLDAVDGLLFGPDPEQGVFRDGAFVHPGLGITFDVPEAYDFQNLGGILVGTRDDETVISLTGDPWPADQGLQDYARTALAGMAQAGSDASEQVETRIINGLDSVLIVRETPGGVVRQGSTVAVVAYRAPPDRAYVLSLMVQGALLPEVRAEFQTTAASFRRLTPQEQATFAVYRIAPHDVRNGETLDDLARAMPPIDDPRGWLLGLNAISTLPPPGQRIKTLVADQP